MDMKEIIEIGINKLKRDLCTYPSYSSKDKIKRAVKKITGRGEGTADRFFWSHAMMADALWGYYEKAGDQESFELIMRYYQKYLCKLDNIKYPDTVMHGYRLIDLYEKTGKSEYKLAIDKMAEYLLKAPKATDGSVLYRANQKEQVYADTIGMICPFLFRYGAMTGDESYSELALKQILNFMEHGMDAESGLPYHAYNATTKVKQGIIGWGRAVGWILMGIADGVNYLADGQKARLTDEMDKLIEAIIKYQRKDGLLSWQLQAVDGPEDISATGMILSTITTLLDHGLINDKYKDVIDKGIITIKEQAGAYNKCLAECEALSCYPQVYGEYPWGTAAIIRFVIEKWC